MLFNNLLLILIFQIKRKNLVEENGKLQKISKTKSESECEDEHQEILQLKYRNYELEQEIKDLNNKLDLKTSNIPQNNRKHSTIDKNFQEQISVSDDHYKIPMHNNSNVVKDNNHFPIF